MIQKLYRWIAVLMVSLLLSMTLTGCNAVKSAKACSPVNGKKAVKSYENMVTLDEFDKTYTEGLNSFAFRLFSELKDEGNIFISPYSVTVALSMLYNGADGETRQEMAKLLGYDKLSSYTADYSEAANQYMDANSKLLMDSLQNADKKVRLDVADSIWLSVDGSFNDTIEKSLLEPVRYYYNGDIFNVDFKEPKTLEAVNQWVSGKTEGMIDPFISSFSDPELLRLYLINAVYFNGKWSEPFDPSDTMRENFYGKTAQEMTDMMVKHAADYRYLSRNGIRGIEIPYGDGRMVMNILLPEDPENKTIDELYGTLTEEELEAFLEELDATEKTEINQLKLPKFEMEYGLKNLNDALKHLGMKKAFDAENEDFSKIGEDLYVSAVAHKAKIEVEEWGTKASAATGIEMKTTAMPLDPVDFIADVPFIYFIRDTQTNTILFIGETQDPGIEKSESIRFD